jgi:hypothetical protein
MLSTAADLVSLAAAAPWLAVAVLSLLLCLWVYRQGRRGLAELRKDCAGSARAQGERIGQLERDVDLLSVRRRQIEAALEDDGLRLPWWPPDGPRPRDIVREDRGPAEPYTTEASSPLPPVPPFPEDEAARLARHRR